MARWLDVGLVLAGLGLAFFGVVILGGAVLTWREAPGLGEHAFFTVLFGLGPIAVGLACGGWVWRRVRRRRRESLERMLLDLSARSQGRLTAQSVARDTSLTLAEAQAILEELHRAAHCALEVDAHGVLVYSFGDPAALGPPPPAVGRGAPDAATAP